MAYLHESESPYAHLAPKPLGASEAKVVSPTPSDHSKEIEMDAVTSVPGASVAHVFGSGAGSAAGAGMGLGGLALGGIGGLVLGGLLNQNGGGLFGGNNNSDASTISATLDAVNAVNQVGRDVLASAGNTQTAIANSNLATLQSANGLGMAIQQTNTQQMIQSLNSFNQLGTLTQTGFNATALATSQGFATSIQTQQESANDIKVAINALAAQSAMQAASAQLEAQKCCCELKEAILKSTQTILDQNAGFRMQDLQIETSNLRQTLALRDVADAQTKTILHHLIPAPVAAAPARA
jgi:hypothetical protein